jgi:integrase
MTKERRERGAGTVSPRGEGKWRLGYDVEGRDRLTGKRDRRFVTFKGTERQARDELRRLLGERDKGRTAKPTSETLGAFLDRTIDNLEAVRQIGAKTAERYRQLVKHQIRPHLGAVKVGKLQRQDIKAWHGTLLTSGLSDRTVKHAHGLLHHVLQQAIDERIIVTNPADNMKLPAKSEEVQILTDDQIGVVLTKLRGRAIFPFIALALATGARRGELLALRWNDLEGTSLRIERSLEETREHGLRVKPPKTDSGKRTITLPDHAVDVLRDHRRDQLEIRMKLGLGKMPDAALIFGHPDGKPFSPKNLTKHWWKIVKALELPAVTLHALRHTHASALIRNGVDIVTISKRLGHSKPSMTLSVYSHLFSRDDSPAANAINAALAGGFRS